MARCRYQRGSVLLRGKSWVFRWRDDVIEQGQIKRIDRWIAFAEKKKYATKRAALKDSFVTAKQQEINSPTYRALYRSNFRDFAERWVKNVLINLEPSTQASIRSHLGIAQKDPKRKAKRKARTLVEILGDLEVKDITTEILQSMATDYRRQGSSPKTVKNILATMRVLWQQVKAWGFATHDPFGGIALPDAELHKFLSTRPSR